MQAESIRLRFTGSGGEYFRIWIVNLILTILTLGIYSAWAKVRRMQYFYRNTQLNGSGFDYHGTGLAILKGRIIAIALFASYSFFINIKPVVGFSILLLIMLLMPFMLVMSFRFRLFNSSYRGIRFNFSGTVKSAYFNFFLLPVLTLFTMYLLAPFTHQRIKKYQINNTRYGQSKFSLHADAGGFYYVYLITMALAIGLVMLLVIAGIVIGIFFKSIMPEMNEKAIILIVAVVYLLLIISSLLVFPYFMASIQNLIWNNTRLVGHRFTSSLAVLPMTWIIVSNFILVILTLGLYKPFADVRIARYRIDNLTMLPDSDLDSFIASEQQQSSAAGTETAEMFDVDIGF